MTCPARSSTPPAIRSTLLYTFRLALILVFCSPWMGIIGIGVDVLHVPRIAALVQRKSAVRLASRILSHPELTVWNAMAVEKTDARLRFLAVRCVVQNAHWRSHVNRSYSLAQLERQGSRV